MTKQNMLRRALYRILVCLSAITLLIGQACVPAYAPAAASAADPTPTPEPPTPAQQGWEDWSDRSAPPSAAKVPELAAQAAKPEAQARPEPAYDNDYCWLYPRYQYSAAVLSAFSYSTGWDEEIYLAAPLCGDKSQGRLTYSPGADYEPQLSRSNQLIAFVSNRDSTSTQKFSTIYTMTIQGMGLTRLTRPGSQDRMPSFSPDGTKIVFVSTRDGNPEIYVMNSDGTSQKRLTVSAAVDVEPDWSPDGKRIAWVRRTPDSDLATLYTMNPDGTGVKAILENKPFLGQPRWSPSGTRLMVRYSADPYAYGWLRLAIVNSDGTGLETFFPHGTGGANYDLEVGGWLPDERGIIFGKTEYIYYEGEWYILTSGVYKDLFSGSTYTDGLTIPDHYAFTPHAVCYENTPPVITIAPLPEYSRWNFMVNLSFSDSYPGVGDYSLHYSVGTNPERNSLLWKTYGLPGAGKDSYQFREVSGETVYFYAGAVDKAGNKDPDTSPDAWTRVYNWTAAINVLDARGNPLFGVQPVISPAVMNEAATGPDGKALYYIPRAGNYTAQFGKPGYATLPNQTWAVTSDREYTEVLTGPDEQLENRNFEAQGSLLNWQGNGMYVAYEPLGRISNGAARLGKPTQDMFSLTAPAPLADATIVPQAAEYDNEGRLHILYNDDQYGILRADGTVEAWPAVPAQEIRPEINFDFSGQPYLTTPTQVIHWNGTAWTIVTVPVPDGQMGHFAIDGAGKIHAIYSGLTASDVNYMRQGSDGSWQAPIEVNDQFSMVMDIAVETDGTAHMAAFNNGVNFMQVAADGVTIQRGYVNYFVNKMQVLLKYVPGRGVLLITGRDNYWSLWQYQGTTLTNLMNGEGNFASLQGDDQQNIYVLSRRQPQGQPFQGMNLAVLPPFGPKKTYYFMHEIPGSLFEVKASGEPYFLYPTEDQYFARGAVYEQLAETNEISQQISLDASMQAPTLSFFYRVSAPLVPIGSKVEAVFTPDGGDPVTVYSKPANQTDWTHAWADLTPFAGQSGKIAIRVAQAAGEVPVYALIDEVSVASLPTPVLESISPTPAAYPIPADAWIDLYGENLQQGAQVYVGEAQAVTVEYLDTTHIRFQSPELAAPGVYVVRVVNPGGGENLITLYVGAPMFTPIITR